MVVEVEIFLVVFICLKDKDEYVKKNVFILIREIVKYIFEVKGKKRKKRKEKFFYILVILKVLGYKELGDISVRRV